MIILMPQTMEQTLDAKLEQTGCLDSTSSIVSPFLFTRPDSTQDFLHDTYRDFFLAKYFSDGIKEGRQGIEDVYINYLSYTFEEEMYVLEDGVYQLKDMPVRRPLINKCIQFFVEMSSPEIVKLLNDIIAKYNYSQRKDIQRAFHL